MTDVCIVGWCERPVYARGLCKADYSRLQRGNDPHLPIPAKQLGLPCKADDCDRTVTRKSARGLCPAHYQRLLATGTTAGPVGPYGRPAAERFFAKVEQAGDCWHWTAGRDDSGYGLFSAARPGRQGRTVRVHIWSFEYFVAPVPDGLQLDHTCHDTWCELGTECLHRRCVNPWHLEPVPPLVNTQRGCAQRRTHCPTGHAYTTDNTYINPKGAQVCRTCMAASRARYDAKKRAA